jgi:hypothetical protein
MIDPVSKEILPFLAGQNFLEGIVSTQVYSSLVKAGSNTPGNKTPLARDAEKLKYCCLM